MDKAESKFKNTAKKMNEALIRLISKKTFSEISVSEICKEADVNRSTFYSHYQNTYELLKETRHNTMKSFYETFSKEGIVYKDPMTLSDEELDFITPKFIIPYLTFVKENQILFKVYINNLSSFEVDEAFNGLFENVLKPIFIKNGINDKSIMEYVSKFFLTGITAIVSNWVNNNCKDDIMFVCEIIILCVRPKMY